MAMKMHLKKKNVVIALSLLVLIGLAIGGFFLYKYLNSDTYKNTKLLEEKGYTKEEISVVLSLEEDKKSIVLSKEYNPKILEFFNETYYINENLDRYLAYSKENSTLNNSTVVSTINVNADNKWYTETTPTDMTKEYLILVNKFNYLEDNYEPDDLVNMSIRYAFEGKTLRSVPYEAFVEMANDAKKENITLIANSSFRNHSYQTKLYTKDYDDEYVARPGFSEHQTGLAIDIMTTTDTGYSNAENFETTSAYSWLMENAYKYGFILRYPKDKENITGFSYESWHFRYVGVEVATKINELGITFDEYYAYFLK